MFLGQNIHAGVIVNRDIGHVRHELLSAIHSQLEKNQQKQEELIKLDEALRNETSEIYDLGHSYLSIVSHAISENNELLRKRLAGLKDKLENRPFDIEVQISSESTDEFPIIAANSRSEQDRQFEKQMNRKEKKLVEIISKIFRFLKHVVIVT